MSMSAVCLQKPKTLVRVSFSQARYLDTPLACPEVGPRWDRYQAVSRTSVLRPGTMLLDQLCRLGFGAFPRERDLGQVAASWAKVADLDKLDPWRLRYGEIIGTDWNEVDRDAWVYAARDPIATRLAFVPLRNRARELARHNKIDRRTIQQYGLLSQRLQIRAGIALAAMHHRGICVDTARRKQTERRLRDELQRLTARLDATPELAGVFRRDKQSKYSHGEAQDCPEAAARSSRSIGRRT